MTGGQVVFSHQNIRTFRYILIFPFFFSVFPLMFLFLKQFDNNKMPKRNDPEP